MGAPYFFILLCGIFLAIAHASPLDGFTHSKRALDVDTKLTPLIESLNLERPSNDHHKRNDEPIIELEDFKRFNGDHKSFYGFVSRDKIGREKTGDEAARLVKELASQGYSYAFCDNGLSNLVAALYIPDLGVFVGSIPRSKDTALKLYDMAKKCPDYSNRILRRLLGKKPEDSDEPEAQLHAEDMVMTNAIAMMAENGMNPDEGLMHKRIAQHLPAHQHGIDLSTTGLTTSAIAEQGIAKVITELGSPASSS
ncbi:hypothetical protein NUU61_007791 [Penicillium alfredii]|uniref:Uncharacterized protein n=1 Tax=Penicillium alfredii TaxID=1506179 RepID=A0A9W9ERH8_9EURO|nr:uncharacterized protein NUU61_007791 [Penicillium alfredii]KAJ5086484.1 hypothetical protein NUU61_007791 [Penicillium alfredii]